MTDCLTLMLSHFLSISSLELRIMIPVLRIMRLFVSTNFFPLLITRYHKAASTIKMPLGDAVYLIGVHIL